MFTQNVITMSAAVHELSCPYSFWAYLAMVKNPKSWSCDLDLWLRPWNSIGLVLLSRDTCLCKISSS